MARLHSKMEKQCFKCKKTKDITEFYKHQGMVDGHVGKCKECNKKDVKKNYRKNKTHYEAYYARRRKTKEYKKIEADSRKRWRIKYPEKMSAHQKVHRAIIKGTLVKEPCIHCGKEAEGHHEDYSKPLEVLWLCLFHHKEIHKEIRFED